VRKRMVWLVAVQLGEEPAEVVARVQTATEAAPEQRVKRRRPVAGVWSPHEKVILFFMRSSA
jgi:hypothetical protein